MSKNPKPKITIKREKVRGKYYIAIRKSGRYISRRKWTKKFTLKQASRLYKKNQSLNERISKMKLVNVTEIKDSRPLKLANIPKSVQKFQVISWVIIDGSEISARSYQRARTSDNLNFSKQESLEFLYARIGALYMFESDIELGEKYLKDNKIRINQEVIYYG